METDVDVVGTAPRASARIVWRDAVTAAVAEVIPVLARGEQGRKLRLLRSGGRGRGVRRFQSTPWVVSANIAQVSLAISCAVAGLGFSNVSRSWHRWFNVIQRAKDSV